MLQPGHGGYPFRPGLQPVLLCVMILAAATRSPWAAASPFWQVRLDSGWLCRPHRADRALGPVFGRAGIRPTRRRRLCSRRRQTRTVSSRMRVAGAVRSPPSQSATRGQAGRRDRAGLDRLGMPFIRPFSRRRPPQFAPGRQAPRRISLNDEAYAYRRDPRGRNPRGGAGR